MSIEEPSQLIGIIRIAADDAFPGQRPVISPPRRDNLAGILAREMAKGVVTSDTGDLNCPGTCYETFARNDQVTLTATPNLGSQFSAWSGDCSGTAAQIVVDMVASRNT